MFRHSLFLSPLLLSLSLSLSQISLYLILNKHVILHVYDFIHFFLFIFYDTITKIQIIYIKKQNVNSLDTTICELEKSW